MVVDSRVIADRRAKVDKSPIFIHSMLRSGSTYLFATLRELNDLYCYYEPMHELVAWASADVTRLNIETHADKMQQLRHPEMQSPYFDELQQVWPAWQHRLAPEVVYGGYFAESFVEAGGDFYAALCDAAPGRPVFSECRTAGRIAALKQGLGGWHAYLWRNPWDQWWSTQVDGYFEASNRMVAHANALPPPLLSLREALGLTLSPDQRFSEARDFYLLRPLDLEASYGWFYGVWLHTLELAIRNADLLLNIDSLSQSEDHRAMVSNAFAERGVGPVDFSDASAPSTRFTAAELEAFVAVEARVHNVFQASGWDPERLPVILALREQHRPITADDHALSNTDPGVHLAAERRRERWAHRGAQVALSEGWQSLYQQQSELLRQIRMDAGALHRVVEHDRRVLADEKARVEALKSEHLELEAFREEVGLLRSSLSWRLTAPLRRVLGGLASVRSGLFTGRWRDGPRVIGQGAKLRVLRGLSATVYRSPPLSRLANAALDKWPALRRWVSVETGGSTASAQSADQTPALLSPRAQALYRRLEGELSRRDATSTRRASGRS